MRYTGLGKRSSGDYDDDSVAANIKEDVYKALEDEKEPNNKSWEESLEKLHDALEEVEHEDESRNHFHDHNESNNVNMASENEEEEMEPATKELVKRASNPRIKIRYLRTYNRRAPVDPMLAMMGIGRK